MSYTGSVDGQFAIDPPLKWSDIRESRFYLDNKGTVSIDDPGVVLLVDVDVKETDEGESTIRTSRLAVPWRESFDCRKLDKDVKALAEAMAETGRTVTGEMVVTGDYAGDIWRVVADKDGVRKEEAKFQWPDGTEVRLV